MRASERATVGCSMQDERREKVIDVRKQLYTTLKTNIHDIGRDADCTLNVNICRRDRRSVEAAVSRRRNSPDRETIDKKAGR